MRSLALAAILLVPMGVIRAQGHLLDPIEIIDPALTVSVVASMPAISCNEPIAPGSKPAVICSAGHDLTVPVAADGTLYFFERVSAIGCDGQDYGAYQRLMRIRPGDSAQEVLRLHTGRCVECSGSTCTRYVFGPDLTKYDVTNGVLLIWGYFQLVDARGADVIPPEHGRVSVAGFPAMPDTLVTDLTSGQIATNRRGPPDGFRVAPLTCWADVGCIRVLARDRDGKPISDAQVTITKEGEGVVGEARTGDDGSVEFGGLAPAQDYTIRAASAGLSTTFISDVRVQAGRTTSIPISLRPAQELRE